MACGPKPAYWGVQSGPLVTNILYLITYEYFLIYLYLYAGKQVGKVRVIKNLT